MLKQKTVYLGRCNVCHRQTMPLEDIEERDWRLITHKQKTGHAAFRRWIEDRFEEES